MTESSLKWHGLSIEQYNGVYLVFNDADELLGKFATKEAALQYASDLLDDEWRQDEE